MLAGTPARQGLDFNILLLETEEASATPHSGEKSAIKKNSKLGWLGHKLNTHALLPHLLHLVLWQALQCAGVVLDSQHIFAVLLDWRAPCRQPSELP